MGSVLISKLSVQIAAGIAVLALLCSCATEPKPSAAPLQSGSLAVAGYLLAEEIPSSVKLLPPPPAPGSAAAALDEDGSRISLTARGSPRWELAAADAVLTFPAAAESFSCALDLQITQQTTPRLYTLMRRMLIDAGRSTGEAKRRYQRARPFVVNQQPTCSPEAEAVLRNDGSYPSGHSAIGWAWALALAEVAPERADVVLARGRTFGDSRIVCNVHWSSDVVEGRTMASATVARLHAKAEFRADLAAAVREVQVARGKRLAPTRDCAMEAKVLAEG